ncbi:hypothetical protein [Aquisphaera insulae]|uniref:hypothetical protein n=1 Tax=Aquisphaera insulae TaxID=2712864 RepID=UPI0013EC4647|nr:hypothetical protein [Aquisphaera insulae]
MANKRPFHVWLANPQELKYNWSELCKEVAGHFVHVTRETDDYDSVIVRSTMTKPVLHANELLVYVLAAKLHSVVDDGFGPGGGPGGYTAFQRSGSHLTASEAYMHPVGEEVRLKPRELAIVIFHEAMHNILQEGDELHRRGGMAADAEHMNFDTVKHRKADDRDLARALSRMAPQWLDGWLYAKPIKKVDLNSDDPLGGL